MSFHEAAIFPNRIAYGATGGPRRRTEIYEQGSGYEERNSPWSQSRREFNISTGIKSIDDLQDVIEFWEARQGRLYGFRFKDFIDFKSCKFSETIANDDQTIGTADGSTTAFQLVKAYTNAGNTYTRTINKPISGTVKVAVNGVNQASGWTVDTATGVITFTSPPSSGAITAGFEFHVPVRFDTERMDITAANFNLGNIPNIILTELRV